MKKMGIVTAVPQRAGNVETRFWGRVNKRGPVPAGLPHLGPCWLWTGGVNKGGYGIIRSNGAPKLAHRISYEMEVGPIPDGKEVDHRCRVPGCVRPSHLRAATRRENSENQAPTRNSKSGVRGVVWNAKAGKWQARTFSDGKYHHAGLHETVEAAAEAVRLKRLEVHTHNEFDHR